MQRVLHTRIYISKLKTAAGEKGKISCWFTGSQLMVDRYKKKHHLVTVSFVLDQFFPFFLEIF